MAGLRAFREAFVTADLQDEAAFSEFEGRSTRYAIYWSYYEGTSYRDFHKWAQLYRVEYGLYKYIRSIYNPAYRIGEFWKGHLWGGALDPEAGDGKETPSALPIITDNQALRPAIAQLWRWSNWQSMKDIIALNGAILGDIAIKVIDDPARSKVYLSKVHPGTVKELTLDPWGNVKGYTIEETRPDPTGKKKTVTYTETASRDGDNVIYKTLKDGQPYAWDGIASDWDEPYGFIPLIFIKHNDVGLTWGWSELHPEQAKFREADDLASKLSDQIRKMVDAAWLFSGVTKPTGLPATSGATKPTAGTTLTQGQAMEPGREEIPALYGPTGADAKPLVAPLDIPGTTAYIKELLALIEHDYPELSSDVHNVQGEVSGRALRLNRQPAEIKVQQRRAPYDDALVRAHQMAIAIGGYRKYEGFQGFNLDSFSAGNLDHSIGERSVFAKDPLDDLEVEAQLWEVANKAKAAGIPLLVYLKRQGWTDQQIKDVEGSPEFQTRLKTLAANAAMAEQMQNGEMPPSPGQAGTKPGTSKNQGGQNEQRTQD